MNLINKTVFMLLLFPFFSHAALTDYSKIESDCREDSPGINNSIVMGCADLVSDTAKKDMNIVYQKIYKIIEVRDLPYVTKNFETAQKSWLTLRENWCDFQGFIIGTPMYSICRMDMNISRVNELNGFLEQIQN